MNKLYSNTDDCLELSNILKEKFNDKIEIYGTTTELALRGKYQSLSYNSKIYPNYNDYIKSRVLFSYEYNKDGYLKLKIYDGLYKHTLGHKLAVLSDFYEVIKDILGMPKLFYITNEDDSESLYLEWIFNNIDISINNPNLSKIILLKKTDKTSNILGLPIELLDIIYENKTEYLYYKINKNLDNEKKLNLKLK